MPAPAQSLPDHSRWISTVSTSRRRCTLLLGAASALSHDGDQAAICAPANALSHRAAPSLCPARAASRSITCSATARRGSPSTCALPPNNSPRRADSTQRVSVTQRSRAEPPTTRDGHVRSRTRALDVPCAYSASASPIGPPPYHRPRSSPWGPTTSTARHARHRYRRRRTSTCTGGPCGPLGPRTWRSTMPCPTMTRGPLSGCPAAPQHGQTPGRAVAHDGRPSLQALIPSGLAMNLQALRFPSTGAKHGGGERVRPKKRSPPSPFSGACSPFEPPPTPAPPR